MEAFGLSHTGLQRAGNEDAYAVAASLGFFAVADGVGGSAAGEVASRMAIDVVADAIENAAATRPESLSEAFLVGAVRAANAAVRASAAHDRAKRGMGTTFTGLLVLDDRALIAHVGDSRAYLLRERRFHQLTEDHTLVNAYVRAGVMTREAAATSEIRNVIVRAVGLDEEMEVDTRWLGVRPGDLVLLASDGLHGVVAEEIIAATLLGEHDLTRAAALLVEHANDAGGPDNVTVVLLRLV
jgi:serine/threonine protein phosphatase PrpC